ncbi:hypothetical protein PM082_013830 [Marasmius tenuissimus]|nr:hypothetical protein PM082_013830 [Marasmius tenuissimus]
MCSHAVHSLPLASLSTTTTGYSTTRTCNIPTILSLSEQAESSLGLILGNNKAGFSNNLRQRGRAL